MEKFYKFYKFYCVCLPIIAVYMILSMVYFVVEKPLFKLLVEEETTQLWGDKDAVPDEETARKIADVIIERRVAEMDNPSWHQDDVTITFDDEKNEWNLHYWSPPGWAGGGVEITLRRDNGAVTSLWFTK